MARPWNTLERVDSAGGALELRQRGEDDFLITVAGRVLMTSAAHRSECDLATWVCEALPRARGRLLIGGLGMGYTLHAALEVMSKSAFVRVAELEPAVVRWCRGPLAALHDDALADPRVDVAVGDVMGPIREAAAGREPRYHGIALDLFEGPRGTKAEDTHPLYGIEALTSARDALTPGGALGIWSEDDAPGFVKRLERLGFAAERRRAGRGGRRHTLFRARVALRGSRGRPKRRG